MSSSTAAEATALPPPGKDLASDARVVSELKSLPSETSRAPWRKLSMREVSSHRTLRDGWIAVNGRVYDISAFATTHPGFNNAGQVSTALAIARMLGKDATAEFEEIHSDKAWRQLRDFQVGVLARDDEEDDEEDARRDASATRTPAPPVPSWLAADRDFWIAYANGVSADVLRYLTASGYPQRDDDDDDDDDDDAAAAAAAAKDDKPKSSPSSWTDRRRRRSFRGAAALAAVLALRACVRTRTARGRDHARRATRRRSISVS
ncbi:cytochrome b5 reductase [Micromonas pusilla CCMP1545]|uniref:Cytochrome b5 reductase n=1 Tax=Micromonas pusilla (strain CCMP1545) TaxID=564608 RepID=C1MRK7_MICPC|nr:cytochrome b5 reductase [Micromonas pusilla CCMP1545]EEH57896.1 cytochrome b5 reductase [Micromonas pusilla CCMP1545]|eukprot:XP_003057945.1 cytochrome b5 reductase [Micromonas pusilla CCMP1545]